jgi:hypothetical protein
MDGFAVNIEEAKAEVDNGKLIVPNSNRIGDLLLRHGFREFGDGIDISSVVDPHGVHPSNNTPLNGIRKRLLCCPGLSFQTEIADVTFYNERHVRITRLEFALRDHLDFSS